MALAVKPEIVEKTSDAGDFCALAKGILAMCEPFGPVHSFKLVHNRGTSRVACLIELESAKEQPALARALGGSTVNSSVCFEIPVRHDFEARSKVVALASQPPPVEARLAAR
jgi:hypothetical protein